MQHICALKVGVMNREMFEVSETVVTASLASYDVMYSRELNQSQFASIYTTFGNFTLLLFSSTIYFSTKLRDEYKTRDF